MTLVGVIAEVKYSGLERPADNAIFRPFSQQPWPNVFLIARTNGDTRALTSVLQRRIAQLIQALSSPRSRRWTMSCSTQRRSRDCGRC